MRATSTKSRCGKRSSCRRERFSSPASSPIRPTWWSIRSWCRSACSATRVLSARKRHRRHRLRLRRPLASADRVGEIARAGRGRGAGQQSPRIPLKRGKAPMMADKMTAGKVDVIDLIDRHPVTGFQIGVLILCMLVAALDGFDTQAIGYTAPAIAHAINLPMPQFGQVGSAGLLGAAFGALSFGPLADLFGRKWFMIVAIIVFAIFSYLTAQSASLEQL